MATITVKNIPDDIYARIKEDAKNHHRSVNSYVIELLENKAKLVIPERSRPEILQAMRKLREEIGPMPYSLVDSLRQIRDGEDDD